MLIPPAALRHLLELPPARQAYVPVRNTGSDLYLQRFMEVTAAEALEHVVGGVDMIFGGGEGRAAGRHAAERILRLLRESCGASCLLALPDNKSSSALAEHAGRLTLQTPLKVGGACQPHICRGSA